MQQKYNGKQFATKKNDKFLKIMKIYFLITLLGIFSIAAENTYSQSKTVSAEFKNVTLTEAFHEIERNSDYLFLIMDDTRNELSQRVDASLHDKSIEEILDALLKDSSLTYSIVNRQITIARDPAAPERKVESSSEVEKVTQQSGKIITGSVVDVHGESIIGANIIEVGTASNGTVTDIDGAFSLRVANDASIQVSYIGYLSQTIQTAGNNSFNITLHEDTHSLDELIVVGYGSQKRSDVTGAVASLGSEVLDNVPAVDITQTLQGRVAGMNVTFSGSSAEGGSSNILIRGKNSLTANNNPFIVLDGIPYESGNLSEINPNDIESINVLKDASAAAIYGARAANGVILITTKKGSEGKMQIGYSGYYGISTIANLPDMQDAETFFETKLKRFGRDNISITELDGYLEGRDVDWVDLATRTGTNQEHNLSIRGGSEKIQYYVSGTFHQSKGIAKNDDFSRYSLRTSIDTQLRDWISIGTTTQLALYDRDGREADFEDAFKMNPFAIPFNEDESINLYPWIENSFYTNPLEPLNIHNIDRTYRVLTSNYLQIDFPFIEGLSYRMNAGGSVRYRAAETYYGDNTKRGLEQGGVSQLDFWLNYYWTLENLLYYNREFGDHTLGLTALYSAQKKTVKDHDFDGTGFPSHTRTNYQNGAATVLTGSDSYAVTANLSQMGRINYSYKNTYLLTLTARRDGYSGFGDNTKFGVFPSVALGWNMEREEFMADIEPIRYMKLRTSYGITGNQAISAYSTLPGLSSAHYLDSNRLTAFGYYPSGIGDPTLGWETTGTFNVGVDFGLFNNRLQGSIDHFRARTTDLLLDRSISRLNGTGKIRQNIGETKNRGIELQLSSINIDNRDFRWTTDFNISRYRNEIVNVGLTDAEGNYIDDVGNRWFIGHPIDINWGYEFGGIFQSDEQIAESAQPDAQVGDVIVVDQDGNFIINEDDRAILASRIPSFIAGLTNTVSYKNLTLSAFISTVQGVHKTNYLTRTYFNGNERSFNYNFWTPQNPHNEYPANRDDANPRNVGIFGKANNASYIRLNDVSLSYRFPSHLIDRFKVNNLELYMNAKNLVTITNWVGLDPEFSNNEQGQMAIPPSRTYIMGLRMSF